MRLNEAKGELLNIIKFLEENVNPKIANRYFYIADFDRINNPGCEKDDDQDFEDDDEESEEEKINLGLL